VIDKMQTRYVAVLLLLCVFGPAATTVQSQQTTTDSSRKIVRKMTPSYPEIARKMNLGGTVRVVAIVAADGDVKSVEPKGGSPILLKAAEDAVVKWKFASGGESREIIEVHFAP
jgi:TonB family protein